MPVHVRPDTDTDAHTAARAHPAWRRARGLGCARARAFAREQARNIGFVTAARAHPALPHSAPKIGGAIFRRGLAVSGPRTTPAAPSLRRAVGGCAEDSEAPARFDRRLETQTRMSRREGGSEAWRWRPGSPRDRVPPRDGGFTRLGRARAAGYEPGGSSRGADGRCEAGAS